jgi:hypothetical protein
MVKAANKIIFSPIKALKPRHLPYQTWIPRQSNLSPLIKLPVLVKTKQKHLERRTNH